MPRVRQDNDARYALRVSFVDENGDVITGDTITVISTPDLQDVTDVGATTTNAVTVGNLTSTGIDDNATSTAITIDSSQDIVATGNVEFQGGTASTGVGTDTAGTTAKLYLGTQIDETGSRGQFAFDKSANTLTYSNGSNAADTRLTVDSGGKLLVGTTSSTLATSAVFEGPTAYAAGLVAQSDSSTNNWARIDLVNQNTANKGIIYLDQDGEMFVRNNSTTAKRISITAGDTADGSIVFYSKAGTERARMTSSGSFCVGDGDPDAFGPRSSLYVCSPDNNTGVSDNTNIPEIFLGGSTSAGGVGAGGEIRFGSRVYGTSGFAAFKGYVTDGAAQA